jgi:hypothetical protein
MRSQADTHLTLPQWDLASVSSVKELPTDIPKGIILPASLYLLYALLQSRSSLLDLLQILGPSLSSIRISL